MNPGGESQARGSRLEQIRRLFASRYEVLEELPWGGVVHYVRAREGDRTVVLAILPIDVSRSPTVAASFTLLGGTLELVESPFVLAVTDHGIEGGVPYLELEDVQAATLASHLATGPLPSLDLLRYATDLLQGLGALHAANVVHTDVVPENILMIDTGDRYEMRILGAALMPFVRSAGESGATRRGTGEFAMHYLAPELFIGEAPSRNADLYAIGALLHHMVVGEPPTGWTSTDSFSDIPALPDIIRRSMGRVPTTRYQDAQAMIVALDWMEVMSSKMSPHTQDIPLWMEASMVGNIPVPVLNAAEGDPKSLPPTMNPARRSSRPPPIRPPSLPPSASLPPRGGSMPPPPMASNPPPLLSQRPRTNDSLLWIAVALAIIVIAIFLAIVVTVRRNRQRAAYETVPAWIVPRELDGASPYPPG